MCVCVSSASLVPGLLFQMKTGPFAEHSNQLWNISAVPSWSKVNQGLIRMYKAEVSGVWPACLPLMTLGPGASSGLLILHHIVLLWLLASCLKPGALRT